MQEYYIEEIIQNNTLQVLSKYYHNKTCSNKITNYDSDIDSVKMMNDNKYSAESRSTQ